MLRQHDHDYRGDFHNSKDLKDIDTMLSAIASLESLVDVVDDAVAEGQLDQSCIRSVQTTFQSIVSVLPEDAVLKTTSVNQLSVEAGEFSSMVAVGKKAIGNIKEQAAKIWEKVLEAFERFQKWSQDIYQKHFENSKRLSERVQGLKERVKTIDGKTPKEDTIQDATIFEKTKINGKSGNFIAMLPKVAEIGLQISKGRDSNTNKAQALIADMSKDNPNYADMDLSVSINGFSEHTGSPLRTAIGTGAEYVKETEVYPGDAQFYISSIAKGSVSEDNIKTFRAGIHTPKKDDSKDVPAMPVLNSQDATVILNHLENILKITAETESLRKSSEDLKKKALDTLKTGARSNPEQKRHRSTPSILKAFNVLVEQPMLNYNRYALSLSQSLMNYIDKSVKSY